MLREAFPEQRLTAEEALRLYSLDAAYSSGEETVKGSIEEGKLADLTILSADPMVVTPEKMADITVEMIVINGKLVVF
jgi:predicted amidohydrolase YtcJ